MLDVLACAEQYKCENVKTQMFYAHLTQEQNVCTITMLKSLKHEIIY